MPATQPSSVPSRDGPMTVGVDAGRAVLLVLAGMVVWFLGVLLLRWVGSTGALGNGWTPLVYALVLAGTVPLVVAAPRLLGLPRHQTLACASIMAATASMMDGIVVRWFPAVYSTDPQLLAQIAASLLWGIGVAVALGLLLSLGGPAARSR
ncbi:MAG: hypothetical protein KIS73_27465 [Enhydrobacter sp.]|nr:hypothetical protein [Enhydrobacter sp.]